MTRGKPETALQASIIKALEQMGVWVIRTAVNAKRGRLGVRTGENGLPDLCLPELAGWAEIKIPGKKLRPAQVAWHKKAKERGVKVVVWASIGEAVATARYWKDEKNGDA